MNKKPVLVDCAHCGSVQMVEVDGDSAGPHKVKSLCPNCDESTEYTISARSRLYFDDMDSPKIKVIKKALHT